MFRRTGLPDVNTIIITLFEVWHPQTLNQSLKNALMSISAKAIRICTKGADTWMLSFINLHEMAGRATPNNFIAPPFNFNN